MITVKNPEENNYHSNLCNYQLKETLCEFHCPHPILARQTNVDHKVGGFS